MQQSKVVGVELLIFIVIFSVLITAFKGVVPDGDDGWALMLGGAVLVFIMDKY